MRHAQRRGYVRRDSQEDNDLSLNHDAARVQAARSAGPTVTQSAAQPSSEELLDRILTSLDDDKAEDVVTIALKGKSEMADYMVIATGRSTRQVTAMAEKLVDRLKQDYSRYSKVEGKDTGDWVLIDTGDVIVHVFRAEVREFYQLEKMWMNPSESPANKA